VCEAAGLRRESLALDLGGHHGFLTWEALRRCVEGGVWSRCEDAGEEAEVQAWLQRVEPLNRPRLWIAPWSALPHATSALADEPDCDAILGYQLSEITAQWMRDFGECMGKKAIWVLAFRRESAPAWRDWLTGASDALIEKVVSLPVSAAPDLGESLEQSLRAASGWNVKREEKVYDDRRRLTSTQAREWVARSAARPGGQFAQARAGLSPEEWEAIAARLVAYFADEPRVFPAAFDMLIAKRSESP
jgi:hypothetical protein